MQKETNKQTSFILIDDDEIDRLLHEALIRVQNISSQIIAFSNAPEALGYFTFFQNNFTDYPETVILLDFQMPEMNGLDFLKHFGRLSERILRKTRIFVVSSSLDQSDITDDQTNYLIETILKKPLAAAELILALEHIP